MSSAVFAITESSAPSSSCIPAASLAPPVPPASSATFIRPRLRHAQWSLSGEPGDADPGVALVAGVDRDQERGQLLDDARRLERAGVDCPQARDQLDDPGDPRLVGLAIAADQDVLVELRLGSPRAGALTVCSAETTVTPSGTISCACWAAEPCQTPSERVALPLTAAAVGTVQSTRSWPGSSASRRLLRFSDWARKGTVRKTIGPRRAASSLTRPSTSASGPPPAARPAASVGPLGAAGADHDRWPALRQAQRQAAAERAGAADDRDRFAMRRSPAAAIGRV